MVRITIRYGIFSDVRALMNRYMNSTPFIELFYPYSFIFPVGTNIIQCHQTYRKHRKPEFLPGGDICHHWLRLTSPVKHLTPGHMDSVMLSTGSITSSLSGDKGAMNDMYGACSLNGGIRNNSFKCRQHVFRVILRKHPAIDDGTCTLGQGILGMPGIQHGCNTGCAHHGIVI